MEMVNDRFGNTFTLILYYLSYLILNLHLFSYFDTEYTGSTFMFFVFYIFPSLSMNVSLNICLKFLKTSENMQYQSTCQHNYLCPSQLQGKQL